MQYILKQAGLLGGKTLLPLTALLVLTLFMSGCGNNRKSFSDGDIRSMEGVYYGTVIDVAEVTVTEDLSMAGPVAGGAVGAIVGAQLGNMLKSPLRGNTGNLLLTAAGIVVGAEVGNDAQKRRYRAMQITMELNNGKVLMVVQGFDEYFVRGDKVRILHMGRGRAKVQHA
jgi:outer membrane lipoprotein SlyB